MKLNPSKIFELGDSKCINGGIRKIITKIEVNKGRLSMKKEFLISEEELLLLFLENTFLS